MRHDIFSILLDVSKIKLTSATSPPVTFHKHGPTPAPPHPPAVGGGCY